MVNKTDQTTQGLSKDRQSGKLSMDETDARTQAQKFADAAREHGADQDEEAFKGVLRKLAKPKVSP